MKRSDLDRLPARARREALRQLDAAPEHELTAIPDADGVPDLPTPEQVELLRHGPKARTPRASSPRKASKYHNIPTIVDGIRFDSIKEAGWYVTISRAHQAGDVLWFCRQPVFELPGGVKYKADFIVAWKPQQIRSLSPSGALTEVHFQAPPKIEVIDVKGFRTAEYKLKKKILESVYPGLTIREV